MKRIIRFIKLFFQYLPHVWYASQFKHSFYIVHGTDSKKAHLRAKSEIDHSVFTVRNEKPKKGRKKRNMNNDNISNVSAKQVRVP